LPTIAERILNAKVAPADLERAFDAIAALPPEDRADIAARSVCLIELFGEPGRHDVSARLAAIYWRCEALDRLSRRPEFRQWSLPGANGRMAPAVLKHAAAEPLVVIDGRLEFDPDRFFQRLLASAEDNGHG
jgi:hypothetical protein